MGKIKSVFLSGLKVIAPTLLILLLIYWIFISLEHFFRGILLLAIDSSFYFNGLGWIAALLFTLLMGLLVQIPFLCRGADRIKDQFLKLPYINTLYRTSSDVMGFLTKKEMKQSRVVKMKTSFGNVVGIITQDNLDNLPDGIGSKNEVAVYVPMSYQIGGVTFIVPKDSVEPMDISVQKGIALVMTAFISGKNKGKGV